MQCPRCNGELHAAELEQGDECVRVEKCDRCSGLWLARGQLAALATVVRPTLVERKRVPGRAEQLVPMPCPKCKDVPVMVKMTSERDKDVMFDMCPQCEGTWLDGGELEAVQTEGGILTYLGRLWRGARR